MRKLIIIEVLALVGPASIVWLVGLVLVPLQLAAIVGDPMNSGGPLFLVTAVAAGTCGLVAIGDLTRKVLKPGTPTLSTRALAFLGGIGSLPLIYIATESDFPSAIVYLLPLAAGAHLVYLARSELFS